MLLILLIPVMIELVLMLSDSFGPLSTPLLSIFNSSLKRGIFPDELKIARLTPICKTGDENNFGNYRPISVLPCFSKILEWIMYKRLYNHLPRNQMLYSKQFGFQRDLSTEHPRMQPIDQINSSFQKNHFTLGVFIDLSKAFDTVDKDILFTDLENYGVNGNNLRWFQSYLKNRKQYLNFNNKITNFVTNSLWCSSRVHTWTSVILNLCKYFNNASDILDPMFADDTNLFYSHKSIHQLFTRVNEELKNRKIGSKQTNYL